MKINTLGLIAGLAIASHANAAYTFVDATLSNTTLNGDAFVPDTNVTTGTTSAATVGDDGFWGYRSGQNGYGGTAYFGSDEGAVIGDRETPFDLITSFTVGAIGTYNLVVVFDKNGARDVAAKIGSTPTAANVYNSSSPGTVQADTLSWDASFTNTRGSNGGAHSLGTFTTTSINESVSVFVNGLSSNDVNSVDQRTQYDGIGYELIPEPSTGLLGAIGALALLRRRRN